MITSVQSYSTFGSLTFRIFEVNVSSEFKTPLWQVSAATGVWVMKLVHIWYLAFGFAVARLLFKREPVPISDPVSRLRTSGLL